MKTEREKIVKLSQNENPFGASPFALRAIEKNYHLVFRYPDVFHEDLKDKIAKKYDVTQDNVVIAAGSVEVMDMAVKAFVGFAENVVTSEKTFVAYKLLTGIHRKECKFAKLVNNTVSVDNIISLVIDKTKLIFIANPNNPTGTIISHDSLRELLNTLPPEIYVVNDEAYVEYVSDTSYPNSLQLQKSYPNLIVLRTFSKIYGLAGLRIGYAITHPKTKNLLIQNKTPFSINSLAHVAALAALDDHEFVKKSVSINDKERTFLCGAFEDFGFNVTPTQSNFICIEFNSLSEKEELKQYLLDNGIIVRDLGPFGIEKGLRVSVGQPGENKQLVKKLSEYLKIELPS